MHQLIIKEQSFQRIFFQYIFSENSISNRSTSGEKKHTHRRKKTTIRLTKLLLLMLKANGLKSHLGK